MGGGGAVRSVVLFQICIIEAHVLLSLQCWGVSSAMRWVWVRTGEWLLCIWHLWAGVAQWDAPPQPQAPSVRSLVCCCRGCRYYDLDVLKKEFGWIDGYVASKPGRYHEG